MSHDVTELQIKTWACAWVLEEAESSRSQCDGESVASTTIIL